VKRLKRSLVCAIFQSNNVEIFISGLGFIWIYEAKLAAAMCSLAVIGLRRLLAVRQSHSDTQIFAYCQWQLSSISGDGFESELSGGTSLEYA
jgi:hypothetical protein